MVVKTNRRSLKYAAKEFSKVNGCARGPPWCYKNTHFPRQHWSVTHTNPEWYVLTVFSAAPCSFDLQATVSYYNFKLDKNLSTLLPELAFTIVTWYTNRCIHFYISGPNKEMNFFIFCGTIVNIVFSFIIISTRRCTFFFITLFNISKSVYLVFLSYTNNLDIAV